MDVNNDGNRKKSELRKVEVEEGDEIVTVRDKEEIERRITQHNKEHFCKMKSTKACKDITHKMMNEINKIEATNIISYFHN